MDAQTLKDRILALRAHKEQKIAEANIYEGAAQEAEYWLSQLEEKQSGGSEAEPAEQA